MRKRLRDLPTAMRGDEYHGTVARPIDDPKAYGSICIGDCLAPAVQDGDTVIFSPSAKVTKGMIVLINFIVRIFTDEHGDGARLHVAGGEMLPQSDMGHHAQSDGRLSAARRASEGIEEPALQNAVDQVVGGPEAAKKFPARLHAPARHVGAWPNGLDVT
jgi:hypothetical protein